MRQTQRRRIAFVLAALVGAALSAGLWRRTPQPGGTPADAPARAASALRRIAAGDAHGARRLVEEAASADPGDADARFVRACLLAAAGDRPSSLEDLEAAARARPRDAGLCLAAAAVAVSLAPRDREAGRRAHGWLEEASRRACASLERAPSDPRAAVLDATALVGLGRIAAAEARLDALGVGLGAVADDVTAVRAAILVARGDEAAAAAILSDALRGRECPPIREMLAALASRPSEALRAGIEAIRSGRPQESRPHLRRAAPDLAAVALLASTFTGTGAASAASDELVRLPAAGAARALFLGCALLANGDPAGAQPHLERALEREPGDPSVLRASVQAALALDDAARAAILCRKAIEAGDASGVADFLLGAALEHDGECGPAADAYRDALARDAALWEASDRLAGIELAAGGFAAAEAVCEAGLAADPSCLPLRVRRAEVRVAAGDLTRAAESLDALAAVVPGCAPVRLLRARVAHATGDLVRARAELEACLRADPASVEAYAGLVGIAARTGTLSEVRAALTERAAAFPRDPLPRFALGAAAEAAGDARAAEREYRAALGIAPGFGAAANNLAWLLASQEGRAAEARPFAETAVRLLPRNPHALDTRGWVRFLSRDFAAAERDLARAARALPHEPAVAARHARALQALETRSTGRHVPEPTSEVPR